MLKGGLTFLLCLFIGQTQTYAQELFSLSGEIHYTNKNTYVYFDKSSKESSQTIDSKLFQTTHKPNLNFGFYSGRIWLKFKMENHDIVNPILELRNSMIDKITLYKFHNGLWKKMGEIGDTNPFYERQIKHRFPQFAIPSSGEYLLKIDSKDEPLSIKMSILSESKIRKRDYQINILAGFFFGYLFFLFIFNIFMHGMLKSRVNLMLVFYIVTLAILQLLFSGYGFQLIWSDLPYFQNHGIILVEGISLLFLIQFCADFMEIKRRFPISYVFIRGVRVLIVLEVVLSLLEIYQFRLISSVFINVITLLLILNLVPLALVAIRKQFKPAKLLLVTFIVVGFGSIVSILNNFGLIENSIFSTFNIQIGGLFQGGFLTLVVLNKYKLYKDRATDNIRAMNELSQEKNQKLEIQVRERTEELISQKEVMEGINKEITASINYANRIQESLIPGEKEFLKNSKGGFVCYLPKEIVSGDFYWSTAIKDKSANGKIVDKTVVCIGETNDMGVPGAVLSVLAVQIAQEAVKNVEISSPGLVLTEINKEFNKLFKKIDDKIKRLSCTICVIDPTSNLIEFTAADGEIFLERNGKVVVYGSNNVTIGQNFENRPYTVQKIEFEPGDSLYLKTDGFEKQLQLNTVKVGTNELKEWFEVNASNAIYQRKINLFNLFEDLMKKSEQIDDICVIGIQL